MVEKLAEIESPTPLKKLRGWGSASYGLVVIGLVEATMEHHLANSFIVHSFEEEVLWQYFRKSLAAVSLRVRRLSKLAQPIAVHRDFRARPMTTRFPFVFSAQGVFDSAKFLDGSPAHVPWDSGVYAN